MHARSIETVIPLSGGLSWMAVEHALQGLLDEDIDGALSALDWHASEKVRALEEGKLLSYAL